MISFFGSVHSGGGCGTELLGAIQLLRQKGVAVRLILPIDQTPETTVGGGYLLNIGCEVVSYEPGMFKTCPVLVSFGEGWLLMPLIKEHDDRPKWVVYSDCMQTSTDDEVQWFGEDLIDEFIFQTRSLADRLGPEIYRRTNKPVRGRHGYRAYITSSGFFPLNLSIPKPSHEFTVLKIGRDDPEKWHPDSGRMFAGINGPANRTVRIEIVGWGEKSAEKVGNFENPENKWFSEFNTTTHTHVGNFNSLAQIYNRGHVLVHVCDPKWEEALGRVFLESILAGVVVIADRRGGAEQLIRHRQTGFLVDSPDEAAYFASHMAFSERLRRSISAQAYVDTVTNGHGNIDLCFAWWQELIKKAA